MSFLALPGNRNQAALTGRVLDAETQKTVPGVRVKITASPAAFQAVLDGQQLMHGGAWDELEERVDLTSTRAGGLFRFIDLPAGAYTLSFSVPGSPHLYGSTTAAATVTYDAQGKATTPSLTANLPPTAIKGKIHKSQSGNPPTAPLWMAEVRAKGSGEYTYTSSTGDFYLTGVEPGPRIFVVRAPGFQTGTVMISVVAGAVVAPTPNPFVLFP